MAIDKTQTGPLPNDAYNASEDFDVEHYTQKTFSRTHSIGFMLTKARNLVTAEMDAAVKRLGITSHQIGIILWLSRGMAATPFEMSKHLSIDTGLMSRMLDKLEAKGLLKRSRSNLDRRVVDLTLTSTGEAIAAEIPNIALPVFNRRLRNFSEAEFNELQRLLHKFIDVDTPRQPS
ncbi:MarR family winged helix-turn-helix transcriptional regulator [Dyella humicola]|uniref:MarR family winged helix-turn-helix transcriptional regulator n=1 Tax=Dyella humicola TaxID=2992126 RepID=UPI00225443B4